MTRRQNEPGLSFRQRLEQPTVLVLDGATGTELQRRGIATRLPLWSASALLEAPDVLLRIHADYVTAGAEVITANTFRTHARNLAAAGWQDRALELTRRAVDLARQAVEQAAQAGQQGQIYVAGSQAPLEDCYRPDLVPGDAELQREHGRMAEHLAQAGVDLILVETQHTIREVVAATRAAVGTGLPVLVSFLCGSDGRLLSGESLGQAAGAVLPLGPRALLLNCCAAPDMERPLVELRAAAAGLPLGVYANIGRADPVQGWINTDAQDPETYAAYAERWVTLGARLVGGCCGTTPRHIRAIRDRLRD